MIPRSGKRNLFLLAIILKVAASFKFYIADLYSAANDPETANDPGPQMIPK